MTQTRRVHLRRTLGPTDSLRPPQNLNFPPYPLRAPEERRTPNTNLVLAGRPPLVEQGRARSPAPAVCRRKGSEAKGVRASSLQKPPSRKKKVGYPLASHTTHVLGGSLFDVGVEPDPMQTDSTSPGIPHVGPMLTTPEVPEAGPSGTAHEPPEPEPLVDPLPVPSAPMPDPLADLGIMSVPPPDTSEHLKTYITNLVRCLPRIAPLQYQLVYFPYRWRRSRLRSSCCRPNCNNDRHRRLT